VVAAQEREKVIRANLDRLAEITRILSEREKQGEGSTYDRLRAERERAEIETELLTSRVAIAQSRSRLAALLRPNTEPSGIVASGDLRIAADVLPIAELHKRALEIRGDYRAQEKEIEQFQFSQRAAQRLRVPEPSVVAGFNRAQVGPGMVSGSYIALSVPVPLFNDGRTEVARFRAEAERTQARRQTLEQRIFAELSGARAALQLHRAAADEYRRGLETQGQRLEQIAQAAYQEGELDILALLDAWRVSLQSRLRLLELNAACKQAEIELERVAGEPVLNKGVLP
jgi:cobalt-zinc-cadmium efflux system outer membrane protein